MPALMLLCFLNHSFLKDSSDWRTQIIKPWFPALFPTLYYGPPTYDYDCRMLHITDSIALLCGLFMPSNICSLFNTIFLKRVLYPLGLELLPSFLVRRLYSCLQGLSAWNTQYFIAIVSFDKCYQVSNVISDLIRWNQKAFRPAWRIPKVFLGEIKCRES